jgi:hypothetical protein
MTDATIDIKCRVTTEGGWLDLMAGPYRLSAEAFVEEALTWRRAEVSNPFVDGSWLVSAVKDNITSAVDVYVRGETTAVTANAVEALKAAFGQINFGIEFTVDDVTYFYKCYASDYTVKTPRELRFSRMAQFSAQVPRHPVAETLVAS